MKNVLLQTCPFLVAAAVTLGTSTDARAQGMDTVFDSFVASPNLGYSSSDPSSYYGALVTLTQTGTLGQLDFSLYNHASSGGSIVFGVMLVTLYDASQGYSGGDVKLPALGTLAVPMDLSASPLQAGWAMTFSSGDVSSQAISLTSQVLVTQQFVMIDGASTRYGIAASSTPPSIGSATGRYFLSNTQNAAALYSAAGGGNAFPLYRISVVPEPESVALAASMGLLGWVAWRRSRANP